MEKYHPTLGILIGEHGTVRSPTGRTLRPTPKPKKYASVVIRGSRYLVHKLVLEAFVGPQPSPDHVGRHLDGDTTNNSLGNLAWGTPADNYADGVRHGTLYTKEVLRSNILSQKAEGCATADLAQFYGTTITYVINVLREAAGIPLLKASTDTFRAPKNKNHLKAYAIARQLKGA